jgi:hypothetical protein
VIEAHAEMTAIRVTSSHGREPSIQEMHLDLNAAPMAPSALAAPGPPDTRAGAL